MATKTYRRTLPILLAVLITMGSKNEVVSSEKIVIGWLEKVYLPEYDFALRGKVDTGAKTSSIHATDMEYIKAEGKLP